ncbi:hypothetical protein POJ06DRAFT_246154 [Lipomyces tetrasporus]|uniref:LIM zinc-binding domain-containing protein n=1 Tax=Lipomyces tetrasporus TaxID=54092 RepID=A0AAD7VUY0_9ASCO|nr:uncharacterized protein POJ06DRAFT_246154 [Lipomyces tetrasporus]KAJ8102953.1 hypothetical protein POJ06DRAFT_246154 [Lipomyces tetrasporus]
MVSFSCEVCNDTVVKKKLMQHRGSCHGAHFTCLDCQTTFQGLDFQKHTSCISEAEKYQKSLYKAPAKKQKKGANATEQKEEKAPETIELEPPTATTAKESESSAESNVHKSPTTDKKDKTDKKGKKDKKKETTSNGSTDVAAEKKEDMTNVTDKLQENIPQPESAETIESNGLVAKADKKGRKDNNKRKLDETKERNTQSSESVSDSDSHDEVHTATTTPAGKKTKVEAEASKSNGIANGTKKSEMPDDVIQSHIHSVVARGGTVSFKSLVKHLRRNKETHSITKAELLRRLVFKTEGGKLILSVTH